MGRGAIAWAVDDGQEIGLNTTNFDSEFLKVLQIIFSTDKGVYKKLIQGTKPDTDAEEDAVYTSELTSMSLATDGFLGIQLEKDPQKGTEVQTALASVDCFRGIENFTYVTTIDLDNMCPLLESLDVSALTNLATLQVSGLPKLSQLILPASDTLTHLECSNCPALYELDIRGTGLTADNFINEDYTHDPGLFIIASNDDVYKPRFSGKALELSGTLGFWFYMRLPVSNDATVNGYYGGDDGKSSYMTFTVNKGNTISVDFGHAETITATIGGEEVTLYGFRCDVTSAQIADKIEAIFHYGTPSEQVYPFPRTTTENEEGEDEGTVTVSEYLDVLAAKNNLDDKYIHDKATAELANAIKNYGYYAQEVLKEQYAGTWNHTAVTLEENITLDTDADNVKTYELTSADTGTGLTTSYTLVLDSSTDLEVYLEPSTVEISGATIDGEECTVESNVNYKVGDEDKTGYRITLPNIPAHKLGDDHEVVVTVEGEKTLTISNLSAMSYVHKVLSNNESSEKLKNAAAAISNYYNKTLAYVDYVNGNTDTDEGN